MAQPEPSPQGLDDSNLSDDGQYSDDADVIETPDEGAGLTPALVMEPGRAIEFLNHAELTLEGQLVDASNTTLYMRAELDGVAAAAVYKPVAGERPLWDFPDGTLAEREVAAYAVSAASGWTIVPPTVLRDGPYGRGMVQLWVDTDDTVDVRRLVRSSASVLYPLAVFDAIINNADRKGGHILPDSAQHVYGIDHGISFHAEEKLRTVIWNWAGEPIADAELDVLARLSRDFDQVLGTQLADLLTTLEVRRTRQRIERLLRSCMLPQPSRNRPPVPWPPF